MDFGFWILDFAWVDARCRNYLALGGVTLILSTPCQQVVARNAVQELCNVVTLKFPHR